MIEELLFGKNQSEKASIKSSEIEKLDLVGFYNINDIEIEIKSLHKIDKGIEILAKVYKNGKPVGFGDGTVELERFKIFNPPILVDDQFGDIIRTWNIDGVEYVRVLKEDPLQAIKDTLAHIILLVGKDGDKIIKGKVGNTTSTFFADSSGDGSISVVNQLLWATAHDATTGTVNDTGGGDGLLARKDSDVNWDIRRLFFPFDTSSIPDTDTVSSAIASFWWDGTSRTDADTTDADLVYTTQSSGSSLVDTDYDNVSSTPIGSLAYASWTSGAYNDITLSDLTSVSKTGYTFLGLRNSRDTDNSAPTGGNLLQNVLFSDTAGTSNDPKLTIVHSGKKSISGLLLLGVS